MFGWRRGKSLTNRFKWYSDEWVCREYERLRHIGLARTPEEQNDLNELRNLLRLRGLLQRSK